MTAARPFRSAVAAAVVLGSLAGCAEAPAPAPKIPIPPSLAAFLPEPVAALGAEPEPVWTDLHRRLLAGEDPADVAATTERELARRTAPAGRLLLAEARLAAGDSDAAIEAIESLPSPVRGRLGVDLIEARARESSGDLIRAHELYLRWAASSPAAAAGEERTRSGAARIATDRVSEELARGRSVEARRWLERLTAIAPDSVETLRADAAVAAADHDTGAELRALRRLDEAGGLDRDGRRRRARLELDAGDPDAALHLYERLKREEPGDAELEDALDRARFRWRLSNAPPEVQSAAREPTLTRADLARLLYWLVPGVRTARGGDPKIASDIVGHPARDEVIRVVNLGLMRVNESLHRFDPDRPARRVEVLEAVLRAADPRGPGPACAPGGQLAGGSSWSTVCQAAFDCGLLSDAGECLPGAGVSGAEALEWIRRGPARGNGS